MRWQCSVVRRTPVPSMQTRRTVTAGYRRELLHRRSSPIVALSSCWRHRSRLRFEPVGGWERSCGTGRPARTVPHPSPPLPVASGVDSLNAHLSASPFAAASNSDPSDCAPNDERATSEQSQRGRTRDNGWFRPPHRLHCCVWLCVGHASTRHRRFACRRRSCQPSMSKRAICCCRQRIRRSSRTGTDHGQRAALRLIARGDKPAQIAIGWTSAGTIN